MLAIEHDRLDLANYLLDTYPNIKLEKVDSKEGNTLLHYAALRGNLALAQRISDVRPQMCLLPNYSGQTPFHLATASKNLQILKLFEPFKAEALKVKDIHGENALFVAAREGDAEIFKWFSGSIDFFKARGEQNYEGRTIEHVVCIHGKVEIVDAIKPRPDTKDFYGNLPLFYAIEKNDNEIISRIFRRGREYFNYRNIRYETIFHIAAKHNSFEALKALVSRTVFVEELLKKDYKGDTPIHAAAKHGSLAVLQFYLERCTRSFCELQNDFGLVPSEAAKEKMRLLEEQEPETDERANRIGQAVRMMEEFTDWVTEEKWKRMFDVSLDTYLNTLGDPNLKIFMGFSQDGVNLSTTQGFKPTKGSPRKEISEGGKTRIIGDFDKGANV